MLGSCSCVWYVLLLLDLLLQADGVRGPVEILRNDNQGFQTNLLESFQEGKQM